MVVPIGVIVAVAIVCIVVAVLSSAQRADEVAVKRETQLFSTALNSYGARVLREVESVATSDGAIANIRVKFDIGWAKQHIGTWLETFFEHDHVFVFDASDTLLCSKAGPYSTQRDLLKFIQPDQTAVLAYMRGRSPTLLNSIRLPPSSLTEGGAHPRAAVIGRLAGRPAIIAGVAVGPVDGIPAARDDTAPIVMSVKFIDSDALASIAAQLRLQNLRMIDDTTTVQSGDFTYEVDSPSGNEIARFAWTPNQPGAEIVHSVIPFIAVALAGFALLAAFVLRYMRRTAVAIAAGESRLRHLAMHDPLCGLPNRILFSERLEAVIDEVRAGSSPAAVFYIDLDHFKDVNDTLGHPVGDELIRNVTLRISSSPTGWPKVSLTSLKWSRSI